MKIALLILTLALSGCGSTMSLSYGDGKRSVSASWKLPEELPSTKGYAK